MAEYRTKKTAATVRPPKLKSRIRWGYRKRATLDFLFKPKATVSPGRRTERIIALLCNDVPYMEIVKSTGATISLVMMIATTEGLMRSPHDRRTPC